MYRDGGAQIRGSETCGMEWSRRPLLRCRRHSRITGYLRFDFPVRGGPGIRTVIFDSAASKREKAVLPEPFLQENQFGRWQSTITRSGNRQENWEVASTYWGKMTENIVQAIARDCLAETLKSIDRMGLQVVFHVHDEVIIDAPVSITVDEICDLMAEPIPWAPGLILKGAGFESDYYMKD